VGVIKRKDTRMKTSKLTVEDIQEAIKHGAKSLTDISRRMGHKGSISGKLSKQIRNLVPDIAERLKANQTGAAKESKATKSGKAIKPPIKAKHSGKYPRHAKNPFREGSSYGIAFDVLAAHPKGIARAELTKEYATASKKPLRNASFDIAVLLSPKSESPTSERHKSCREGYGLVREGSFYQLVLK